MFFHLSYSIYKTTLLTQAVYWTRAIYEPRNGPCLP